MVSVTKPYKRRQALHTIFTYYAFVRKNLKKAVGGINFSTVAGPISVLNQAGTKYLSGRAQFPQVLVTSREAANLENFIF
jgi:hypothetical protein